MVITQTKSTGRKSGLADVTVRRNANFAVIRIQFDDFT
jgi:hypothetical protein